LIELFPPDRAEAATDHDTFSFEELETTVPNKRVQTRTKVWPRTSSRKAGSLSKTVVFISAQPMRAADDWRRVAATKSELRYRPGIRENPKKSAPYERAFLLESV
jgi:hypothetical protein